MYCAMELDYTLGLYHVLSQRRTIKDGKSIAQIDIAQSRVGMDTNIQ